MSFTVYIDRYIGLSNHFYLPLEESSGGALSGGARKSQGKRKGYTVSDWVNGIANRKIGAGIAPLQEQSEAHTIKVSGFDNLP